MEHHQGLALARAARTAAKADANSPEQQKIWSELEAHAANVLESHFEIEETALAPALSTLNDSHITMLLERMHQEHAALRALLSPGGPRTAEQLAHAGELLAQHIRFEERELFELAQARLDQSALDAIARATQQR